VDQINDPLFAPDGSWLVARQSDINLLIFDTATWTANAASPLSWSYPQSLQHLSMEPTGDRIAACIETYPTGKIAVVDTATWLATDVIATPVRPQASAWSPDGAWLAVGLEGSASDGRARVYDTATWALVATITGAWLSGAKLAWSPDSAQLAVGGTNNLVVYDTATWTAISGAPTDQSSALLIYAPDGSRLSLSDSYGDIKTYLANTWTLDTTVTSPDGASTAAISAAYSVKSVAGTVLDAAGDPAARQVALLDRATLALLDSTTSDASTGAYTLQTFSGEEAVVIALDAADDYNDLIRRVVPD
jgi:WD40 repeat protein